jgi:hypothetical protein
MQQDSWEIMLKEFLYMWHFWNFSSHIQLPKCDRLIQVLYGTILVNTFQTSIAYFQLRIGVKIVDA